MIHFGIVGTGWRSEFFCRIAAARPDLFKVLGIVTRNRQATAVFGETFNVPLVESIDEMLQATKPLFVITSVPWAPNPGVIKDLVARGLPVLSETPPAPSVDEMIELCQLVDKGAKIQVAEQYWAQPHHAARLAFVHSGKMGKLIQAQISVAHAYHGISLMRRYLGIGYENATITAKNFDSTIVDGPGRDGPPAKAKIVETQQRIAWFDFGSKSGVFDFTGDQYFSYIRGQRVLVRGERGELVDETAVYLQDHVTPIHVCFERHSSGINGNLEGHHLKGIQAGTEWVYTNPLAPARLSDEEIAVGTCLLRMAEVADGGPDFYSLREACQDHYLGIRMHEAIAAEAPLTTETQPWAS
ncbi:MAG: Gfo/Idh/MocA family oxidoreductase, partial [Chloroflexota bacterium]